METKKLTASIIVGVISASVALASNMAIAAEKMEKCYGVAKVGHNDCGGPGTGHTCQGQATKNNDPNDWLLVIKGSCKTKGGSLTPANQSKNKT